MQQNSDVVLTEMKAARERAESVLRGLIEAQSACEKQLTQENRRDAMKLVTGRSSLENAITATRRMIESFDRQVQEFMRGATGGGAGGTGGTGTSAPGGVAGLTPHVLVSTRASALA
jgi:hypothetical protein